MMPTIPTHAQSLLLQAPLRLEWVRSALPPLGPHDLLLSTRAGAISIGTELPLFLGQSRDAHPPRLPAMTGYESLATIAACGPAVRSVAVGDRVVAFYGHRTAAVVAEDRVVLVPPDINDELALLLILACDTAKGVSKLALPPESRVAITGGGAIGLLTLFNLHARGLRAIDLFEPLPRRRALATIIGARTSAPPSALAASADYDAGFECSSRDAAFQALQRCLRPHGQICVLADGNLEPLTLSPAFHAQELMVVGSSDGLDYRAYAAWFWGIMRTGRYSLARLFEQTVRSDQLPDVFAELGDPGERPIKVLVRYLEQSARLSFVSGD